MDIKLRSKIAPQVLLEHFAIVKVAPNSLLGIYVRTKIAPKELLGKLGPGLFSIACRFSTNPLGAIFDRTQNSDYMSKKAVNFLNISPSKVATREDGPNTNWCLTNKRLSI